jgi:hypothetical protein
MFLAGNAQVGMAENELASGYFEYSHGVPCGVPCVTTRTQSASAVHLVLTWGARSTHSEVILSTHTRAHNRPPEAPAVGAGALV